MKAEILIPLFLQLNTIEQQRFIDQIKSMDIPLNSLLNEPVKTYEDDVDFMTAPEQLEARIAILHSKKGTFLDLLEKKPTQYPDASRPLVSALKAKRPAANIIHLNKTA